MTNRIARHLDSIHSDPGGRTDSIAVDYIFSGSVLKLTRYRCTRCDTGLGDEQVQPSHCIAFPRHGVYVRHSLGKTVVADTNHAIFFNGGQPYRTSHPFGCGDHGVAMVIDEATLRDIVARYQPAIRDTSAPPLRFPNVRTDAESFILQSLLFRAIDAEETTDPLEVEETGLLLVDRLIRAAFDAHDELPYQRVAKGTRTATAHRNTADQVMGVLASRFGEPLTLDDVAARVHVSPFHLCRIFRAEAGTSMHKYLRTIRLRAALERILAGEANLSTLALETGFSSHSHLTSAFRTEFGMTPSTVRQAAGFDPVREFSTKLKA